MIVNYYKNNEIKNGNKNIWAENEAEEEVQIYMAKKKSEEEEKKKLEFKKEEEKQFQMVIEESQKENENINNIINESQNNNNINNINIINSFNESQSKNNINIINPIKEEEFDENYGICPITLEYMKNPVLSPSGNYYEKSAIIDWIEKNHNDPFSRESLSVDMLVEDEEFRKQIIKYRKKFNK